MYDYYLSNEFHYPPLPHPPHCHHHQSSCFFMIYYFSFIIHHDHEHSFIIHDSPFQYCTQEQLYTTLLYTKWLIAGVPYSPAKNGWIKHHVPFGQFAISKKLPEPWIANVENQFIVNHEPTDRCDVTNSSILRCSTWMMVALITIIMTWWNEMSFFFCLGCPSFQQRSRKVLLVCFGISPGSRFLHAQQFLIEAMHGSWLFLGKMSPPKKPTSGKLDGFN